MHFCEPPKIILKDVDELRAFLAQFPTNHPDEYSVKSIALCALIEQMFSENGERFEYNSVILKRAMQDFGLPPSPPNGTEGGMLGSLVYNAQRYVTHDWLIANDYLRFTQELVNQAGDSGKKIKFHSGTVASVRRINETWYAMPKGSRKRTFIPDMMCGAKIV